MKQNTTFERARKAVKYLMAVAVVMCVVALMIGDNDSSLTQYMTIAAIICLAATILVMFTALKCPYCGKAIIRKCLTVKSCPHCGRDLVTGVKGKKRK